MPEASESFDAAAAFAMIDTSPHAIATVCRLKTCGMASMSRRDGMLPVKCWSAASWSRHFNDFCKRLLGMLAGRSVKHFDTTYKTRGIFGENCGNRPGNVTDTLFCLACSPDAAN
jgi:hypothetical protein